MLYQVRNAAKRPWRSFVNNIVREQYFSTSASNSPTAIIDKCISLRESIQPLNDV